MKTSKLHELFLESTGISTDTRKIAKGSIFFALKGENYNANKFAAEALNRGATFVVVDEDIPEANQNFIKVDDVLKSLQELAKFHRTYLNLPILALTGSNGKTTTKELLNAILSKKFSTVATSGNLNNHIGVPLTLLSMNDKTELGIVEMGANHQKEIEFLCEIAQPDFGYITNFGKAHLEGFGSVEGVIKGKKELYEHLKANQKTVFLNINDPLQALETTYSNHFSFGSLEGADVIIEPTSKDFFAGVNINGENIIGNLTGAYNSANMAAAYAIGIYFKVPPQDISNALQEYQPKNNRSQMILKDNRRIIMDAYNANPSSMAAALENLERMPETPRIAILGDMFELGAIAAEEHQNLSDRYENSDVEKVYLIGENFYTTTTDHPKLKKFRSFEEFKNWFQPSEFNSGTILIKGSRGMALERVMELL